MIRLYVEDDLREGGELAIGPDQTHYLANVMRLKAGDELRLFNGRDGEWRARLVSVGKRAAALALIMQERPQTQPPDLDLIVAVVKRARLETIAEKAAELGARRVLPVTTSRPATPASSPCQSLRSATARSGTSSAMCAIFQPAANSCSSTAPGTTGPASSR